MPRYRDNKSTTTTTLTHSLTHYPTLADPSVRLLSRQVTSLDQTVIDQIQQVLDQLDNTLTYNLGLVQVTALVRWDICVLYFDLRIG